MENLNYFIATLNVERIMEDGTSKKVSEEEIVRLQKELKETRAAMRILSERKESDGKK